MNEGKRDVATIKRRMMPLSRKNSFAGHQIFPGYEAIPLAVLSTTYPMKRAHLIYSGRVQGVGFRFTTEEIARSLGVSGWIRNLPSGEVEVLVQAPESAIEDLMKRVSDRFGRYIKEVKIDWESAGENSEGFEVRY